MDEKKGTETLQEQITCVQISFVISSPLNQEKFPSTLESKHNSNVVSWRVSANKHHMMMKTRSAASNRGLNGLYIMRPSLSQHGKLFFGSKSMDVRDDTAFASVKFYFLVRVPAKQRQNCERILKRGETLQHIYHNYPT